MMLRFRVFWGPWLVVRLYVLPFYGWLSEMLMVCRTANIG